MRRAIAAAFLLSGAASAQSLNAQGIARLNQDIASLWTHDGVPMAQSAAAAEAPVRFSLGLKKALQKAPRIALPIDQPAE